MMIRSSMTNGKVVSQYTGSPSCAFRVEIACFNDRGTFVPEGIVSRAGDVAAGAAEPEADPDAGGCSAAVCGAVVCVEEVAGVCAIAHVAIKKAPATRVHMNVTSLGYFSGFEPVNSDAATRAPG